MNNYLNESELKNLSLIEIKEVNGGITVFGAVLAVAGVIGAAKLGAYYAGYAHGWIEKQIEKING